MKRDNKRGGAQGQRPCFITAFPCKLQCHGLWDNYDQREKGVLLFPHCPVAHIIENNMTLELWGVL